MHFTSNLKTLRTRKALTQENAADALQLNRSTLNGYENGVAEPKLDTLITLADFYQVSLDTLVKADLAQFSEADWQALDTDGDQYIKGSKLRVLATTVNADNEENIELVPEKARAGYALGYADPGFIGDLPVFNLPFLSPQKKYRTFQISGDSMLPIRDRSWVTGEYIEDWNDIKDGQGYIVLTKDDGIVFKIVYNRIQSERQLLMCSLNPLYEPYELPISEVLEVWKFKITMSHELPEAYLQ